MPKRAKASSPSEPDHEESDIRIISGPRIKLYQSQPNIHAKELSTNIRDVEFVGSRALKRVDACYKIPVPDVTGFSFKKVWAFTGPGFLMSVSYLDPGNIESDIQIGTSAEYKLLWILLASTIAGILMQRLAVRLGVVSGMHLAEMCNMQYRTVPKLLLWLMIEITIFAADMQAVIGTAVALYLMSYGTLPIWAGVLITIIDTFTILLIDKFGLRKLEAIFGMQIAMMAICFGYQFFSTSINAYKMMLGMFVPWCLDCDDQAVWNAIGVIGAVMMPHSIFLHSALVKTRDVDRTKKEKVKDANIHFFVEASIALFLSFVIHLFVVCVFAQGLFHHTNNEVREICELEPGANVSSIFPADDHRVHANIYNVGIFINGKYGTEAMYFWAIGLLAAGQSSTMSGVFAGQFVMEGFWNLTWSRWKRVLFTRSITIIPTFILACYQSVDHLLALNDILNAIMAIHVHFAAIPLIAFTSSPQIMGDFANSLGHNIVVILVSSALVSINVYFATIVLHMLELEWYYLMLTCIVGTLYVVFGIYLIIHMIIAMGNTHLLRYDVITKYVMTSETLMLYT